MALVEVQGLVKRYTPTGPNAVNGISFEIREGEIFSLLGPNGAGKSTTIGMLSTLVPPTEGDALICGYSIRRDTKTVRRYINVVPQEIALYEGLSPRENLRFWGEMRDVPSDILTRQIDLQLERIGLADRATHRVRTFSGGMKRRLNLAVGLLGDPKFVMMDEPTVGIDPQSRRYILDWVKELNRQHGLTILYTTHYMEEAQELSHRIGIVDHGQLIALGTLEELTRMVGEFETVRFQVSPEEGSATLAGSLQNVDGVLQASAHGSMVLLTARSAETALPATLTCASGLGLSIRSVEVQAPTLETVFLHLTGRALRD
jgi:ABC-2 type transport system ATP-binding protein